MVDWGRKQPKTPSAPRCLRQTLPHTICTSSDRTRVFRSVLSVPILRVLSRDRKSPRVIGVGYALMVPIVTQPPLGREGEGGQAMTPECFCPALDVA